MDLVACGLNHKTAPLAIRERVAVSELQQTELLRNLIQQQGIREVVVLSTCNRTEWYGHAESKEQLIESIEQYHSRFSIKDYLYVHDGLAAVRHLMRVACGLDSMALGESQIFGQVKEAYRRACECGTLGKQLDSLFRHVFAATKRVRTHTTIGVNPISIATAAVNLAKRIYADLSNVNILLIGSGETISLVARHLVQQGTKQFFIANRTLSHAEMLAKQLQGQALTIQNIPDYLEQVDIVISATASPLPIIGKGLMERILKLGRVRPMLLVDLAVPRDIEPEVSDLADVFLYNIDDLQNFIEQGLEERRDAAKQAESIIELALEDYVRWQRSLRAVESIQRYRRILQVHGEQELQRALSALRQGKASEEVLRELTKRLLNKTMHQPTLRLRKAGYDGREDLLELANFLFEEL